MKLTTEQRKALEALRDVMRKHDIEARFNPEHYGHVVRYIINGEWVASEEFSSHGKVSETGLTKLLEQEKS